MDLTHAVAEQLQQPFAAPSMPTAKRQAPEVVAFLAESAAWLGVVMRIHPAKRPAPAEDALDRFMQSLTCD